jgi:hypothetical protein
VIRRTIFRRAARDDVREIRRWYEEQRPGLGAAFIQSLELCVAQIQRTPEIWPSVDGELDLRSSLPLGDYGEGSKLARCGQQPCPPLSGAVENDQVPPDLERLSGRARIKVK